MVKQTDTSREGSSTHHLFVYGTLRQGQQNSAAQLLHHSANHLGPACARGLLYRIAHYPGFVPSNGTEDHWVRGDLYVLHSPESTYSALDQYEGDEYRRTVLPVELALGSWIEASVYVYTQDVTGKVCILSGDYLVP